MCNPKFCEMDAKILPLTREVAWPQGEDGGKSNDLPPVTACAVPAACGQSGRGSYPRQRGLWCVNLCSCRLIQAICQSFRIEEAQLFTREADVEGIRHAKLTVKADRGLPITADHNAVGFDMADQMR